MEREKRGVPATTALRRGLAKRCPHCGQGRLYSGRTHLERCDACGLVYERNPGDTWAFTIIGDRLPIGIGIALLYFTLGRSHPAIGVTALIILLAVLIYTAPNRWGVGIALHYLSRVYWPEPADPIPGSGESGRSGKSGGSEISSYTEDIDRALHTTMEPDRSRFKKSK